MMRRRDFLTAAASTALAGVTGRAAASPPPGPEGTLLYIAALPGRVLVLDEAEQKLVHDIPLSTGVCRGLVLSNDRKKIFLNTPTRSGIEVLDRTTHKIVSSFKLDNDSRRVWFRTFAVDPQDRFLYTVLSTRVKQIDRFDIELPKFAVIDLAEQKIVKVVDYPKEEVTPFVGAGGLKVSPDGKYLYQFRDKILIFNTSDFKLVEKIELAKPDFPGMENINVSFGDDPHDPPGKLTAVFNSVDPIVHHPVFGVASIDLNKRDFDFTPVGPSTTFMTGLKLTPDRKTGYLVAYRDGLGNRRAEFWVFDMVSKKVINSAEFSAPTQIRFTVSGDGKSIFIYGSAPMMDVYDAATLKLTKTLDLNADLTTTILVVPSEAA